MQGGRQGRHSCGRAADGRHPESSFLSPSSVLDTLLGLARRHSYIRNSFSSIPLTSFPFPLFSSANVKRAGRRSAADERAREGRHSECLAQCNFSPFIGEVLKEFYAMGSRSGWDSLMKRFGLSCLVPIILFFSLSFLFSICLCFARSPPKVYSWFWQQHTQNQKVCKGTQDYEG